MRKKTIVIDMDDTITSGTLTEIINEYLGTNYKDEDFEGFYKQDIIKDKDDFFKFFHNNGCCRTSFYDWYYQMYF